MNLRSTEERLLTYVRNVKRGILYGVLCLIIATALELAGPIIASLRKVRDEKAILKTGVELTTLVNAGHIIIMENGKIVEEGTHKQLMRSNNWYKEQCENNLGNNRR
ncbi:hypothetical protein ACFSTA_00715 [Ornithinibacillus salinisoli]|uniref:ABC transporter ATP-binding protein n=1 Tax=Ornithinibacillus salinisoli TaxID=1848459 RepID=A0ABW4VY54_9BACI